MGWWVDEGSKKKKKKGEKIVSYYRKSLLRSIKKIKHEKNFYGKLWKWTLAFQVEDY